MTAPQAPGSGPLWRRRVVTTRDAPGLLDDLLRAAGADVLHVPLIEVVPPDDGGAALDDALRRLDHVSWVVVTSRHGAARVGAALAGHPAVRTAAVGTATAAVLADLTGRPVDLVPATQTATALVESFPSPAAGDPATVLVAQADRAAPTLVDGLRAAGWQVEVCTAYATRLRVPDADEVAAALTADVVAFASGSAAESWARTIGTRTPAEVVVIGPSTAEVARRHGLKVTAVAADHSVQGLVDAVVSRVGTRP